MRSHGCGDLRADHADQAVQLCGWVDRSRDHGGVIFIDLRDRSGTVQITVDPELTAAMPPSKPPAPRPLPPQATCATKP